MSRRWHGFIWAAKVLLGIGRGDRYADEGRPHLRIRLHNRTVRVVGESR